ncbi:uncharacterized protein PV06_07437 [Exophiala oligosperma]|uniref:Cyclin N-terminal domain-containing protein n=1 Tax=Exophiala oligosperma TaxID=215243 RepID=A0A0D2DAT2_9EURO|nr:uncharacterized protein PV06_07437 [Exophiala oligosperma]KIW40223.1 hypothetical protein PV06_07437 [Exophiala oligosperma]
MSLMSTLHRGVGSLDWPLSSKPSHDYTGAYGFKRRNTNDTYFSTGLPTPPGSKAMPGVTLGNGHASFPSHPSQHLGDYPQNGIGSSQSYGRSTTRSDTSSFNLVPASSSTSDSYSHQATDSTHVNAIAPHLQIPESVNKSKGSLAEFTAEITCLFWFETAGTIQYAEVLPKDSPVERGLLPDAVPTIGFRKWVTTIISTTQVGKNVVLLALMFIYRLKKFNPSVSGKRGSEFRLLTIALMLGNKFLDDNTYTNKTWAEVSGISVTEIHIMEVEFLSNMRYDLYASAEEWNEWKAKLGRFGAFYDKASLLPSTDDSKITAPVTPTSQSFSHKLPSPPSPRHVVSPFRLSPSNSSYPTLPHPLPSTVQLPSSPLRPQYGGSIPREERKRSLDLFTDLPPAKRQQYPAPMQIGSITNSGPAQHTPASLRIPPVNNNALESQQPLVPLEIPRLDVPRVPATASHPSTQLAPLSMPSSRAMASVYPSTSTGYSQPVTPISAIPQNLFQNPVPNLGDGSRSVSNHPSAHTSPSNGFHSVTPTLPGLSPSYFLTHRTSPYRPVRHVNTLLFPPPSTTLQAPVRNIPYDQIHYQLLGKVPSERRTGPLPFMQADAWQRSNVSTPLTHPQYHF